MKFTKEQVKELVRFKDVDTEYGENMRWSRSNLTVVRHEGKLYQLKWEEGLTEDNEDFFEEQEAEEVEQYVEEHTFFVKGWRVKGK